MKYRGLTLEQWRNLAHRTSCLYYANTIDPTDKHNMPQTAALCDLIVNHNLTVAMNTNIAANRERNDNA